MKAAAAGAIGAMAITTQGKQNFYNLGALKACAEMLNAERKYLLNSNMGSPSWAQFREFCEFRVKIKGFLRIHPIYNF